MSHELRLFDTTEFTGYGAGIVLKLHICLRVSSYIEDEYDAWL